MAALLKKRALAEYAHTVEDGPRPAKQIQLTCRLSRSVELQHGVSDWNPGCLAEPSNAAVMASLLALHHAIPLQREVMRETVDGLLSLLQSLCSGRIEEDSEDNSSPVTPEDLLVQVLALLPLIISPEAADLQLISRAVDGMCQCGQQWVAKERQLLPQADQSWPGNRVVARAVQAACAMVLRPPNSAPRQQVLQLVLAALTAHQHHLVKVSCLEAAGELCGSSEAVLALLRHATHHDSRVRTAAFKAMVSCERGGVSLPPEAYGEGCRALEDDYQCVREASITLLKVIATSAGERLLPANSEATPPERLADDAFFRICACMSDSSVRVRVTAATALSAIPGVSEGVLLQTLDKKLFSNMRRKMSYHERQAALVSSGEWSRGRAWGEDGAKEHVSAEQASLTHSAGAFVHGLEDECLEVRSASLDAIALLAQDSPLFANQCLDFLVDMFNDEIEDVRLKAVQVLQRIVSLIRLQEDQLHEILHALKDSWQCIRESVHALLGSCTLTTAASLHSTVEALLDNIRRYPQDVPSIQECMVSLGGRQAGLVAGLVPQLLLTHPYFDAVQPSLHQPHYICKLLLVLNAAARMPTILPVLEEHTLSHYAYLRDTLPNLVPQLQVGPSVGLDSPDVLGNTESFLQQSLSKLRRLECASTQLRLTLYSSVHSDLLKLSALDPTMSAAAQFAALYTRCSLLLTRLLNCPGWLHLESSGNNVQQLVALTFRLVHAFTGLSAQDTTCARGIRLRALALQLVYVVNGSTGSALGLCEAFLNHAKSLRDSSDFTKVSMSNVDSPVKWSANEVVEDEFLTVALNQLKDERRPGTVARTLQPLLSAYPPMPLPPIINPRAIHQASAKITQPNQESEAVHKLTAGLPLATPLDAYLYHIPDPSSVRIRICYPDQSVQHVVPRVNHLQPSDEPHCYRLQTTVLLTAAVWSEACQVHLSLVLDLSPAGPKRKHDPHTIDLCDPTTLMLWPKTMKKAL